MTLDSFLNIMLAICQNRDVIRHKNKNNFYVGKTKPPHVIFPISTLLIGKKGKIFAFSQKARPKAIVTSRSRVLGFGLVTQSIKVRWRLMSHYNPSFQLFSDLVLLRGGQVAAEIQTPKGFLWDAVVHDSFLTCYATAFSW